MSVDFDRVARFRTIDLTTIGRTSGLPTRIEIWWFRVDGRFIITGTPGRRDWYANALADPSVTIHVDGLDLVGVAHPVVDREFRMRVFTHPDTGWYATEASLHDLVEASPMIEVQFDA